MVEEFDAEAQQQRMNGDLAPENLEEAQEAFKFTLETAKYPDLLILAMVAEQLQNYDDMLKIAKIIIVNKRAEFNPSLQRDTMLGDEISVTSEERTIFNVAFSNFIQTKKDTLDYYTAVQKNQGFQRMTEDGSVLDHIKNLAADLRVHCTELEDFALNLLDQSCDDEARIYFMKIAADCKRYKLEIEIFYLENQNVEELNEKKKIVDDYYNLAILEAESATSTIKDFNQVKLGLISNYSLFLMDIMGQQERAKGLAKVAFTKGTYSLINCEGLLYKEANAILSVLESNIRSWDNGPAL